VTDRTYSVRKFVQMLIRKLGGEGTNDLKMMLGMYLKEIV
jgi:hypothetical protein